MSRIQDARAGAHGGAGDGGSDRDHIVVGVLAHVDAGKTTLSEAMLYRSGALRRLGRVDHGDAFLDTDAMERRRGITIFSKQALFDCGDHHVALLDTPGHTDFSSEMERTLGVLDYAILVVQAGDSLSGYTETLWRLLARYRVSTFIFVNKMDAPGAGHDRMMGLLRRRLADGCIDCRDRTDSGTLEDIATLDEGAMDDYFEHGSLSDDRLRSLIANRLLFPCFFGSALKLDGVDDLLDGLGTLMRQPRYPKDFAARVFNIAHDEDGNRLTWIKVTGGSLAVKSALPTGSRTETVDQIRRYSGASYTLDQMAPAGAVRALTGLDDTFAGQGLGAEPRARKPLLEPVLSSMLIPGDVDPHQALAALRVLEDEDPMLRVRWVARLGEIHLQLMGEMQLEVIRQIMHDRFSLGVDFGPGDVMYQETIDAPVEGVGHFEPLRHYAEVHLLLEPTERGSGMSFATACSEDVLDRNWQRLVLTHLREREHLGVLTGSPITDMRITLLTGRGHLKHTEGGDFREATYRAVRQGLMKAASRLLEPWYRFRIELPQAMVGRAMSDVQRMGGHSDPPAIDGDPATLEGEAPVASMRGYAVELGSYTHGRGQLSCTSAGYRDCHDAERVVAEAGYDPTTDLENTPDSVFCAHGAGYAVAWNRVEDFMHVASAMPR